MSIEMASILIMVILIRIVISLARMMRDKIQGGKQ